MSQSSTNVLVVASGSIGVLQLPNYLRGIKEQGWGCKCIMTPTASRMLPPSTISSFVDTYTDDGHWGGSVARVPHLDLPNWAHVVLVLPATMNFIGNLAGGLAPNLAATAVLSTNKPVLVCPNLPEEMAEAPALKRNIARLEEDGYYVFTTVRRGYSVSLGRETSSIGVPPVSEIIEEIALRAPAEKDSAHERR
jgi:phosphopantothenoylcysteine decarboxylase/phosphopantothenate--cysteine ligase